MKIDRDQVFRELEPPPGGAARLRRKLDASRGRGIGSWWPVPVGAAVVAAVVALVAVIFTDSAPDPSPDPNNLIAAEAFDRLLGRESVPYELTVRRGDQLLALTELESSNPRIRLYRLVADSAGSAVEDNAAP